MEKLEYFREGGSEKHLRDIMGILKLLKEQVNREYIEAWVEELELFSEWNCIVQREQETKPQ